MAKWALIAAFAAMLLMTTLAVAQDGEPTADADYLAIYHIDVGQGDATLIVGPTGRTLLMDTGGQKPGREKVGKLLEILGIETLNYLVISHFHADHLGGADQVRKILIDVPVRIFDRGTIGPLENPKIRIKRLTQYGQYLEAMELPENRAPVKLGKGLIDLGPGVSVLVAVANGCVFSKRTESQISKDDENATSVALVINYGNFDYFIGGDLPGGGFSGGNATENLEELAADVVGDVDVMRFSHHGSQTSSNRFFLKTLAPEIGVISVGNGHPNTGYKHPSRGMLDRVHDLLANDPGFPLQTVYMTNRGHTQGGLTDSDLEVLKIVGGDIVVMAGANYYTVNGKLFATDGKKSGAAVENPGPPESCKLPAN